MPGQIKSAGAASAAGEVGQVPGQLPCLGGGLENLQATCLSLPTPRKPSNNLFRPFRALENLQATCFGLSDASETFKQLVSAFPMRRKPSNNLFWPFRCVGNLQTTCFGLSDASETFKQLVSAFPTPRGRQGRPPSLPGTVFWGTRPASQPRQGPSGTTAQFAGYGFF